MLVTESLSVLPFEDTVQACIRGGASVLQLREKARPRNEILDLARRARRIVGGSPVTLIVNDDPEIAHEAGADGVHVGAEDMDPAEVRARYGRELVVGVTCHSMEEAARAVSDGADYLGVGPMFPSSTKDAGPVQGPTFLASVLGEVELPCFAIGGIDRERVAELAAVGARAIAVCGAVLSRTDMEAAVRELDRALRVAP